MNCLFINFITYMLWSRDVSNILEYKPSLKLLTINRRDRPRIMYIAGKKYCQLRDSNVEGFRVLGNRIEVGCQYAVGK